MIDLSRLNGCITPTKFKMETVSSVLGSNKKGDFMSSIDLKDTYIQIPSHPDSRPHRWIALEGKVYQFKSLCFGLPISQTLRGASPDCQILGSSRQVSFPPSSCKLLTAVSGPHGLPGVVHSQGKPGCTLVSGS